MRVTISHTKTKAEVMESVEQALTKAFRTMAAGPVEITNEQRTWEGSRMTFSFVAKAGFLQNPVHGTLDVGDKDVTVDVDLGIFSKFVSEQKVASVIETNVRGLLG
jgi:hypothetical protein